MKSIFLKWAFVSSLVIHTKSLNIYRKNICFEAKTCIHNGKETCGRDYSGKVRKFLDSCDLLEFNCLKGTDYKETSLSKCKNLPHIDNLEYNVNQQKKYKIESINKKSKSYDDGKTSILKEKLNKAVVKGSIEINDDEIEGNITLNHDTRISETANLSATDNPLYIEESGKEEHLNSHDDEIQRQPASNSDKEAAQVLKPPNANGSTDLEESLENSDKDKIAEIKTTVKPIHLSDASGSANKEIAAIVEDLKINDDVIEGNITLPSDSDSKPKRLSKSKSSKNPKH